jgi:hypothetical protein
MSLHGKPWPRSTFLYVVGPTFQQGEHTSYILDEGAHDADKVG